MWCINMNLDRASIIIAHDSLFWLMFLAFCASFVKTNVHRHENCDDVIPWVLALQKRLTLASLWCDSLCRCLANRRKVPAPEIDDRLTRIIGISL